MQPGAARGVARGVGASGKRSPTCPRLRPDVHMPFPKTHRLHQHTGTLSASGTPHPSSHLAQLAQLWLPKLPGMVSGSRPCVPNDTATLGRGHAGSPMRAVGSPLPAVAWPRAGTRTSLGWEQRLQERCCSRTSLLGLRIPATSHI